MKLLSIAELLADGILANGTSIGMKPLEGLRVIEDVLMLRSDLIVTDVVYNPVKTKFLEQTESVGARTINGLGMMLWQGALAFEMWTGQEMPVDYIKEKMFE